jgi:hypothetical protein
LGEKVSENDAQAPDTAAVRQIAEEPKGPPARVAAVDVLTEEYKVLRAEIGRYQDHQNQVMNFSFLVLTGILAYVGTLLNLKDDGFTSERVLVLLYIPLVFVVLASLYSDRTVRIIRLADYLTNYLRPKVSSLVGIKIWQWEIYKRHASPMNKRLAYVFDKLRWAVFILPTLGCLAFYFGAGGSLKSWPSYVGVVVSLLCLAGTIFVMFVAEETSGVEHRPPDDLDLIDPT